MYFQYDYSSSSRLRRFANRPKPVTAAKAPRSTDDLEASVPVFGNCCLDLPADSDGVSEDDASADAEVLAETEALVDTDSDTDMLVDSEVLVDTDSEADTDALTEAL